MSLTRGAKKWGTAAVLATALLLLADAGHTGALDEWLFSDDTVWGGYAKLRGMLTHTDSESLYRLVGTGTHADAGGQVRINLRRFLSDTTVFDVHYELTAAGGQFRKKQTDLGRQFPAAAAFGMVVPGRDDRRRLMDLTAVVTDRDDHYVVHRLDRLSLTYRRFWRDVRIGRQALTWGNGLVFNPMDLFNPFSPTDIEREYKAGDDMAVITLAPDDLPEIEMLCVPRRDPDSGSLEAEESAAAVKVHLVNGVTEFDVLTAVNHEDKVVGIGARGYLGDAAWRWDTVYTAPGGRGDRDGYLSIVANLDYAWMWLARNWYGFVEVFHNGAGHADAAAAAADADIRDRIDRGELFVLGTWYGAAHARLEIHPLVNLISTAIVNLSGPSGVVQPRVTWDAAQNLTITAGADIHWGVKGSEFGGFDLAGTDLTYIPPDRVYLWGSYYF